MITITNAFSGKLFCIDQVLESLFRLQVDSGHVQGILVDNSGSSVVAEKLVEFKSSGVWDEVIILTCAPGEFSNVAEIYNYLRPHVKGMWFSTEDDVILEPNHLRKLLNLAYQNYDAGIVAGFMEARRGWPGPMVWKVGQDRLGLRLDSVQGQGVGSKRVDAVHTGCTVIKQQVYQDYVFHQNGVADRIIGHDIHLCLDAAARGLGTLVAWEVRPGHATTAGVLYPASQSPRLSFLPPVASPTPRVSVVIPTHSGRAESLCELLRDLQSQTHPEFEALIASDGPDPEAAKIVAGFRDARFRYYELPHQYGCWGAVARNTMLQKASGDLVVFCDSDVQIKPEYLETMVSLWSAGYGVGFAQVEFQDGQQVRVIPEDESFCIRKFHIDSLNGFVDAGIAKGFFWDLHEAHDFRYWQQILDYVHYDYGFMGRIVGSVKRSWGKPRDDNDSDLVGQLATRPCKLEPMSLVRMFIDGTRVPNPEYESIVAQDAGASIVYALNILKGERFALGEPAIAQNAQASLFYTGMILKGARFVEAEDLLGSRPDTAVQYCGKVGCSWRAMGKASIEEVIKQDTMLAKAYFEKWS